MSEPFSLRPTVPVQNRDPSAGSAWTGDPITLRAGDCLAGMALLHDHSVDHAIFDPPYAKRVHEKQRSGDRVDGGVRGRKTPLGFSHLSPKLRDGIAEHMARLVRRWVILFTDAESISVWKRSIERVGLEYIGCGLWLKPNGNPQKTGDRPSRGYDEHIVIAHATDHGKPIAKWWNGGGQPAHYTVPLVPANERKMVAQKPVALMSAILLDFTDAGDLILDPTAGYGSTLVACKQNRRKAVGWEKDGALYKIAEARCGMAREQLALCDGDGRDFRAMDGV